MLIDPKLTMLQITGAVLPSLTWQAGRTASALRTVSLAHAHSIFLYHYCYHLTSLACLSVTTPMYLPATQ